MLTIETEKTSLDITAIRSGFVVRIIAPEGETVPVSQVIGLLADSVNEQIKDTAGGQSRTTFVDQDIAESVNGLPQDTGQKSTKVSPVARTMVKEYGIDLEAIRGTGPNGRIQKLDVEKYIKQKEESGEKVKAIKKGPETRPVKKTIKISPVRRTIAQITLKSKTTIPHYYLFSSFDVTDMLVKRKEFEQSKGIKPSIDSIMIAACALTLEKYPLMNASWEKKNINVYEEVRIGFGVDTDSGIIIPHLINPHKKGLIYIENAVQELVEKARKGLTIPEELKCGAFSISNLGMYLLDVFIPIIYPGEVAMLGIGRAKKTPVWIDNEFVPRDMMRIALSLDHRIVDGGYGAKFLQDLNEALGKDGVREIFQ